MSANIIFLVDLVLEADLGDLLLGFGDTDTDADDRDGEGVGEVCALTEATVGGVVSRDDSARGAGACLTNVDFGNVTGGRCVGSDIDFVNVLRVNFSFAFGVSSSEDIVRSIGSEEF
jgi:hypothetical protein